MYETMKVNTTKYRAMLQGLRVGDSMTSRQGVTITRNQDYSYYREGMGMIAFKQYTVIDMNPGSSFDVSLPPLLRDAYWISSQDWIVCPF
jgi:hypothetical protein